MGCFATGQSDMPVQCQINEENDTGAYVNLSQNIDAGATSLAINFAPVYENENKQRMAEDVQKSLERYDAKLNKEAYWSKRL